MNTTARFRKIEKTLSKNFGQMETVVLKEYGGKYFIEKDGKNLEIKNPKDSYPNKMIVIVKHYGNYDLQNDIS